MELNSPIKAPVPDCLRESQCREVVIDAQVPIEWALPLYGYVMPIIVTITLATNSFIVLVLSRRHLRTPTNFVLLAMAVTELLTGLSCMPWLLYYYSFEGYKTDRQTGLPAFWCSMFPYMASILPSIFHTTAIWLTVYLAVQRYIYICLPKLVQNHCTMKRSKQAILIICIASIWIYAPELFATYNQSYKLFNARLNETRMACLRIRTVFIDFVGNNIYYYTIYGLHTLLSHTLPCIFLVCFTWKLITAIRVADKRYALLVANRIQPARKYTSSDILGAKNSVDFSMDANNYDISCSGSIRENSSVNLMKRRTSAMESKRVQSLKQNTRMLIAVILLFLVTEIPAALIFSLHVSTVALRITYVQRHYTILNKLLIVRNVLIIVTYPLRFAIYCGMSQQFRDCVRQMLVRRSFLSRGVARATTMSQSKSNGRDDSQNEPMIGGRISRNNGGHFSVSISTTVHNNNSLGNNNNSNNSNSNNAGRKKSAFANESCERVFPAHRSSSADNIICAAIGTKYHATNGILAHKNNHIDNNAPTRPRFAVRASDSVGCEASQKVTLQIDDSGCGIDSDEESNEEDGRNHIK